MNDVEIPSSSVPSDEGEWELLDRQASEAKQAMLGTMRDMLDVRVHIQQHPWLAVGAACAAGVVTAGLLDREPARPMHADNATAPKKNTFTPILTRMVSEAAKLLIPTLFTAFAAEKGRGSFLY